MSNTSDQSRMEKSLLLVVPIDPMVKIFTVGEMFVNFGNMSVVFFNLAYDKLSDGSIGSIGECILRSNNYFTDGEMT